ncbi:MAG: phosphatase PAP2 family protein [Propionicimonas sp.]
MPSRSRYRTDPTQPTPSQALRDVVVRGFGPAAALALANVALGRALVRRAGLRERETAVVRQLQSRRTPLADVVARVASTASDVPASVLHGAVAVAVLQRRTHQWWVALIPALALVLEASGYLAVGAAVNRERPDVPRLDHDQPTSSFPSGHQGATVALMVVYALMARDVRSPRLRAVITTACLAYPTTVAWSRVYVGMHYPSDVAVGTVNGLASGLLAWTYLRRQPSDLL